MIVISVVVVVWEGARICTREGFMYTGCIVEPTIHSNLRLHRYRTIGTRNSVLSGDVMVYMYRITLGGGLGTRLVGVLYSLIPGGDLGTRPVSVPYSLIPGETWERDQWVYRIASFPGETWERD